MVSHGRMMDDQNSQKISVDFTDAVTAVELIVHMHDLIYSWWFYGYLHAKSVATCFWLVHKQWKTVAFNCQKVCTGK